MRRGHRRSRHRSCVAGCRSARDSGRVGGSRRGGGCSDRGDGGGGAAAAAGAVVQWCSEHLKQHPLPERSDQLRAGVGCSRGSRCPVSGQENVGDACH